MVTKKWASKCLSVAFYPQKTFVFKPERKHDLFHCPKINESHEQECKSVHEVLRSGLVNSVAYLVFISKFG